MTVSFNSVWSREIIIQIKLVPPSGQTHIIREKQLHKRIAFFLWR